MGLLKPLHPRWMNLHIHHEIPNPNLTYNPPHLHVRATSEQFLPARVTFRADVAGGSHWLQPMLVVTVHWWLTPVSVGGLLSYTSSILVGSQSRKLDDTQSMWMNLIHRGSPRRETEAASGIAVRARARNLDVACPFSKASQLCGREICLSVRMEA